MIHLEAISRQHLEDELYAILIDRIRTLTDYHNPHIRTNRQYARRETISVAREIADSLIETFKPKGGNDHEA